MSSRLQIALLLMLDAAIVSGNTDSNSLQQDDAVLIDIFGERLAAEIAFWKAMFPVLEVRQPAVSFTWDAKQLKYNKEVPVIESLLKYKQVPLEIATPTEPGESLLKDEEVPVEIAVRTEPGSPILSNNDCNTRKRLRMMVPMIKGMTETSHNMMDEVAQHIELYWGKVSKKECRGSYDYLLSLRAMQNCYTKHCGKKVKEFRTRFPKLALRSFQKGCCHGQDGTCQFFTKYPWLSGIDFISERFSAK